MPELPEVETVGRLIRPRLMDRSIEAVRVQWKRTVGDLSPRSLSRQLIGARFTGVRRRAKYLVLELAREDLGMGGLVVHLRMTGRLQVVERAQPKSKWLRVSFDLDREQRLEFIDVRKFGRVLYAREPEEILAGLGPEPLGPEFTAAWLYKSLRAKRRMLKPLLLDQSFVAGLGNIYVDEALHAARLHPQSSSERVSRRKSDALHAAIQRTLQAAIEREGSSFDSFYRTPEGQPGSYQHQFQVYGRQGQACLQCGRRLIKIVVGQRGTHLCPRCQAAPRARKSG